MKSNHLSILSKANENSITYYTGNNFDHVAHLKNCTLICNLDFNVELPTVELVKVANPQLAFYKLSKSFKEDYLDRSRLVFHEEYQAYIHPEAKFGKNVSIAPGSVIGSCTLGDDVCIDSNVVLYNKTIIGNGTIIESNSSVGAAGMMWVWDEDGSKVYLEQLGNVIIGPNCRIGTQCQIVRGSANESSIIGSGTCIAHGSMIGHGCIIGENVHLANGVKLGGSVHIASRNFLSSGSIVCARIKLIAEDILLGAGAVATKDITDSGIYVGCPAKKIKDIKGKHSGVPVWS